ncbi:hypothetical protein ZIOFF_057778 [Zingiber officinale]|uniref:Uncharacterized protein n=1 Tax=Zingiber officinale TaxID=94328 RepID=A0A8J5F819_ZINOF|nr:hypothetical protein ZIOFF_057778 [Zingiber officinale]
MEELGEAGRPLSGIKLFDKLSEITWKRTMRPKKQRKIAKYDEPRVVEDTELHQDADGLAAAELRGETEIEQPPITGQKKTRGPTSMCRLIAAARWGKKSTIEYDDIGRPVYNENGKALQSFIGSVVRSMVPINIKSWPTVPKNMKQKVWEEISNVFDLAPQSEAAVMSSAGQKWRDFKNKLNSRFVWPYRDNPEKLRLPPEQYQIPSAIWKAFVDERLHPSWEVKAFAFGICLGFFYGFCQRDESLDIGSSSQRMFEQCRDKITGNVLDTFLWNLRNENEIMSSSQAQKRKRGKTIMRDIHALHPDHMLVVKFNERGQPYGDLQPTLANFIGTIARNGVVLPLSFLDWRKMPTNRLNDAWKLVTARFCISNCHRRVIMQMMGAAWRRWRTEVKATSYDSNTPLEVLVAIQPIPHGLTLQTWEVLCNYWKSTESQENGRKPSRIEIQQLSRRSRKKGGALIDDEAIRIENLLKETVDRHLQDKPEGTQPIEVHEEVFREVFGPEHSGRVRCLGAGALPSQVFPELCKRSSMYWQDYHSNSDMTDKFKEMGEKIKDMELREAQRQMEIEQMKRQMKENDQFQNFARVMLNMMSGSAGGSHGPESLPAQMAAMLTNIMQQQVSSTAEGNRCRSSPSPESNNN